MPDAQVALLNRYMVEHKLTEAYANERKIIFPAINQPGTHVY